MLPGMSRVRIWLPLLLGLLAPHLGFAQNFQTKVRLLLESAQIGPGSTVYAAVDLNMPEGWHTYWANPSDSGETGQPTRIEWDLPSYIKAGDIEWPTPTKVLEETGAVLSYTGRATLLVPLQIASNAPSGPLSIKAKIRWLECQKACVPGNAQVSADLVIDPKAVSAAESAEFAEFRKRLPIPQAFPVSFRWLDAPTAKERRFVTTFRKAEGIWDFFPEPVANVSFSPTKGGQPAPDGQVSIEKSLEPSEGTNWPTRIPGIVVRVEGGKPLESYRVAGLFDGTTQTPESAVPTPAVEPPPLAKLLLFAFIGGLILNIMPCVLPVIALKILGFVRQSAERPGKIRNLGLAYATGVLASFGVLGGLVIAVKLAGKSAHQGLLFQNPIFLVVMTALMVLIALNLFGVFEVSVGGSAIDGASQLASREGLGGAFFNGVLATVLATPCTAPFLSLSIGFAVALDARSHPGLILLFFLTAGLGLAAPYLALCMQPRWLKLLPKPGTWMVRFKMIMGFPILATGAWLFSLAARHYGSDGLLWLGMFLVTISLAAWLFGEFVQRADRNKAVGAAIVAGVLAAAYFWMLESELEWRTPAVRSAAAAATSPKRGRSKIDWSPWSPALIAAAQAEGHPVFVDFTADWCNTCQANKRTSIEVAPVMAMLKTTGAATLLADYTLEDPAIAAELAKYHRPGVPLVLVYSKDPAKAPRVLPEVLTRGIVLEALEWAANPK